MELTLISSTIYNIYIYLYSCSIKEREREKKKGKNSYLGGGGHRRSHLAHTQTGASRPAATSSFFFYYCYATKQQNLRPHRSQKRIKKNGLAGAGTGAGGKRKHLALAAGIDGSSPEWQTSQRTVVKDETETARRTS